MKLKARHLVPLLLIGCSTHSFAADISASDDAAELVTPAALPDLGANLNDTKFVFAPGAKLERGQYVTPFSSDYGVSFERDTRSNRYTVFNTSIAHSVGVTTNSFAASADPRLAPLTRLESTWSWSAPGSRAQVHLGDAISNPGSWSSAVRFGGIQIGTTSSAPTDLITAPLLGTSGMAVLPTTADLLSDDLHQAAHGGSLSGIAPQAIRPGNIALSVNDALGRRYAVSRPLFQNISLLTRGQTDFSVEAGRVREDFARRSDGYGAWLVSGTYRYGLGSKSTLDAHAASVADGASVLGLGLSNKVGATGMASASMATSRTQTNSGWLARMGYEVNVHGVNLAVRSRRQSPNFQDLKANAAVESLRERTVASAGVSLNEFGNVSIAGVTQAYGDRQREGVLALSHSVPLGASGLFSTAATFAPGPVHGSSVLMSVSYPFTVTKRKISNNNTRHVINMTDQNLAAVLDTAHSFR